MKKFLSFCLIALSLITPSFADNEADKKVVTSLQYVKDELNKKQDNIPAQTSGTYAVTYGTSTTHNAGEISPRQIKTSLGTNTSDTSLPTVGAVNTEINKKQDKIPAKDTNTVVTYTGTVGVVGEKGIYQDEGTYSAQTDNLVEAGAFNTAVKTGLDSEFLCAGNASGGDCWLWSIHNEGTSRNLFDIDRIPESTSETYPIHHNEDGSITVATNTSGNSAITTTRTLSQLAPELEIGKTYVFSINTTGTNKYIYLGAVRQTWQNGATKTITQDMLNSIVSVYASGVNTSATIYNIQIEEGTTPTAFQPYMSPRPYTTLVPNEYTPLEYLESSGTQYIDTGLTVKSNTLAEFEYQFVGSATNYVFGQVSGSGSTILGYRSNRIWWFTATNVSIIDSLKHKVVFSQTGKVYKDGALIANRGTYNGTNTATILLFAERNDNSAINKGKVKIYNFTLKEGTSIVQNLIPARRNSDDVLGMYDTVSGTFKTNAGSGTFTAGPDISNVVYMPQEQ